MPLLRFHQRKHPMEHEWRSEADRMVESQVRARGVRDERVLAAMKRVPRHRFVPESRQDEAYADCPLPIGHNQTISQPYIVGVMTEFLAPRAGDRILEIGTGCGYQAAILAELVDEVHSVELVGPLANLADENLRALDYDNIHIHVGDGNRGWPEAAPYDGILLTAAPSDLPPDLLPQLKEGRNLVAPIGPLHDQVLMVYEKGFGGKVKERRIFEVRFVPLLGGGSPP